jgi:signal transduction histidine kinase
LNKGAEVREISHSNKLQDFFWEARSRILACYVVLILIFVVFSIPAFRQLLFSRINERVQEDLHEQMDRFQEFAEAQRIGLAESSESDSDEVFQEFLFEEFLSRQLPEDDMFLIALRDGGLYQSSPKALPEPLLADSPLLSYLANAEQTLEGEQDFPDREIDSVLYVAEPVEIDSESEWVFVVAHTTAGERAEAVEATLVIVKVMLVAVLLASILAWVVAGRVLAPLRRLLSTARTISESDLNQRIPVQGSGELAELATTFNSMLDRLQAAFVSQRSFIDDAGHELRTPITIIQGHLELMSDDPEEQQETLSLVNDELDRMSRFVEDLLLLAKAERPDFLMPETVDVSALTQAPYTKAKGLANRDWRLEGEAKGQLVCDRQRITQAVMNLTQNAVQHTRENAIIALGSSRHKNNIRFWVRDTGEGITLDNQEKIFERFARIANRSRPSEGAGLGLSIVRAIAEAHGGQVELFSRPGIGSTFTLVIPLDPPSNRLSYEQNSNL